MLQTKKTFWSKNMYLEQKKKRQWFVFVMCTQPQTELRNTAYILCNLLCLHASTSNKIVSLQELCILHCILTFFIFHSVIYLHSITVQRQKDIVKYIFDCMYKKTLFFSPSFIVWSTLWSLNTFLELCELHAAVFLSGECSWIYHVMGTLNKTDWG